MLSTPKIDPDMKWDPLTLWIVKPVDSAAWSSAPVCCWWHAQQNFYARLIRCFFAETRFPNFLSKTPLLIFCAWRFIWTSLFILVRASLFFSSFFFFFFWRTPHKTDRTNRINSKQVRCNWSHHVCTVCINKQLLGGRNGATGKLQIQRWMLWLRAPRKHLYVTQERVWESV